MSAEANDPARKAIAEALDLLRRNDAVAALEVLNRAAAAHPKHAEIKLQQAAALRTLGRLPEAVHALDAALAIDPYFFLALLSKGALYERMALPRLAARTYRDALRIAPRAENTPRALENPIRRAREVVAAESTALANHLRTQLNEVRARHANASLTRFDECLDVYAGTKRIYAAEPVQLHVPRLPAIPFFDRDTFAWLPTLEAATAEIRDELQALMAAGMPGFAPYIAYPPGTPVNQWDQLNHSRLWSSFWLWRDGVRQEGAIAQCPRTAEILSGLPMADQPGFAPTALFSALAARTRIPPHTGSTNARLVVHLPLVLPGKAGFRVGNETREWRMGEAWVFDDTIEHEAWNDADETRVILIFDVWNPLLSTAERELISAMMNERNRWYAAEAP